MPAGNGGPGAEYLITGHKWFMSAPMCDAFLVLAQAPGGLSCFLMPRFLPDGSVNALAFQRLKDKLGNRSNASSEVEFQAAHAWLIGEEGRGVPTIIEMVTCTRLDCAVGSAGLMRLALANAIHHCRHRTVFQKHLVDQPLMSQVLADLALDVEAATVLSFRLSRSFDRASDPHAAAWRRLMTPVTKYWVCKIGPALAYEAMECLGGNGYVEEGLAARLYRELPLNAIWEGSGNVMALDLLRVLQREPETVEIVMDDLGTAVAGMPTSRRTWRGCKPCCMSPVCSIDAGGTWPRRWPCWRPAPSCAPTPPPRWRTRSSARGCPAPGARPTARASTGPIRAPSSTALSRCDAGPARFVDACCGAAYGWAAQRDISHWDCVDQDTLKWKVTSAR